MVFSIAAAITVLPVNGATTITLTVNPPNPAPNSLVEFQGAISPNAGISEQIVLNLYRSSGCNITQYLFNVEGSTERTGSSYSIPIRLGVAYLVYVRSGTYSAFSYVSSTPTTRSSCVNFTISEPIPEFPTNVPMLLVFTVIAAGILIRKTNSKKPDPAAHGLATKYGI